MNHIPGCYMGEAVPCPANVSLHNEVPDQHWWSGWPGAYCMKCGTEDSAEMCIGSGCGCPCHNDFYEALANAPIPNDAGSIQTDPFGEPSPSPD